MFCPQCGCEYRPGFTKCADCGVNLVDRLPEEPRYAKDGHVDNTRLVPVLETRDRSDVLTIKMVLDPEGVEYFIQGETLAIARNSDPFVLLVKENDLERVKELFKGVKLNYSNSAFNPKRNR